MVDLKVLNIDKYITEKNKNNNTNPYLFNTPARVIICGSSNSGKSNLLMDILTRNKIHYTALYIYSRHINQSKYKYLKKYVGNIEKKLKKEKIEVNIIKAWDNSLDDLIQCDNLDEEEENLIVIDDFNSFLTKKQKEQIGDLFCSCRHKNTSIFFLGQLYHEIPRSCRLNLSYLCLFDNNNRRELSLLMTELSSDKDKKDFRDMCKYVWKDRYNFLLIDNVNPKMRYRKNFDEILE